MTGLLKDLMDERAAATATPGARSRRDHLDRRQAGSAPKDRRERGGAAVAAAVVGAVVWQGVPAHNSSPNVTNPPRVSSNDRRRRHTARRHPRPD